MIPLEGIVQAFDNIIGWPYETPGYNDSRGIDCSGAFVYAYNLFGERIYHGSNRIIRVYCRDVRDVNGPQDIAVGMAIFKSRSDLSNMKAEYKPGGRYYNPALPYDYYHMGLVTSVNPVKIVNATTPRARVDTDLSRWQCAGYLNAVDYGGEAAPDEPAPGEPAPEAAGVAFVVALSGSTVNLRARPDKGAVVLERVPLGTRVDVLERMSGEWWRVRHGDVEGYMMREFLCAPG